MPPGVPATCCEGSHSSHQSTIPLAYDPGADTWTLQSPMSQPREHLAAAVVDGRAYVIGGRWNGAANTNQVEEYDSSNDTWSLRASMPMARGGLTAAAVSGRIHVTGGEDLQPGGATFPEHEIFDPATDSWLTAPSLPAPRHGLTSQTVDGRLYVIGGGPTPGLSSSGLVEVFLPAE